MTDRTVARVARTAVAAGVGLAAIGSVGIIRAGSVALWWSELNAFLVMLSVFFAVFVWLAIAQQPRNAVVWIMAVAGFACGFYLSSIAAVAFTLDEPSEFLIASEASIPADIGSAAWIMLVADPLFTAALFTAMTFGLLLFPDGRLASRRSLPLAIFAGAAIMLTAVAFAWGFRPGSTTQADRGLLLDIGFVMVLAAMLMSLVALWLRYRRSAGPIRDQFKWIVWGTSMLVPMLVVSVSFGGTRLEGLTVVPLMAAGAAFIGAYGVAVTRYRLYEIDVVISKTVTYVALAAVITGLYTAVVLGPLVVFGAPDTARAGPGLMLPLIATVIVAVLFEPSRARLQTWANRLVYGDRATPHEILSLVTARLSEAGGSADDLAELLARGTGAEEAVIWYTSGSTLQPEGIWPPQSVPGPISQSLLPDFSAAAPVRHRDEALGAATIGKRRNDPVTPTDRALLADVAAAAGLLLRNLRLNRQLEDRAREVQASRRRLIEAQDAERHRLERDLHDGAQQQVVALKVKLALAKSMAQRDGADDVAVRLEQLAEETQQAVDAMRATAHGIYPPLLESEGLDAALAALRRSAPIPVKVDRRGLDRYPRQVEQTVYFCVSESLDLGHMAGASTVTVEVRPSHGSLDVGVGLQGQVTGLDLSSVTDRIEAWGGSWRIEDGPAAMVRFVGSVPVGASSLEAV